MNKKSVFWGSCYVALRHTHEMALVYAHRFAPMGIRLAIVFFFLVRCTSPKIF